MILPPISLGTFIDDTCWPRISGVLDGQSSSRFLREEACAHIALAALAAAGRTLLNEICTKKY